MLNWRNIDWQGNGAMRFYTGAVIVAGLALVLSLRFLPANVGIWIFDVVILALACIAVFEVMRASNSDAKGVSPYYIYAYIACAYIAFVFCAVMQMNATNNIAWLFILVQIIALAVFALYIYLMNYMDKDFVKECELRKIKPAKAAIKSVMRFLKLVAWPFMVLCALIPLNHLGIWTSIPVFEGSTDMQAVPMFATFALLMVFVISTFTDTAAYFTGKLLKGPKLLPTRFRHISPNKTVSGMVGGIFGGVIGALLVVLICVQDGSALQQLLDSKIGGGEDVDGTVITQIVFIAIGIVGALVTMAGDLFASVFKRRHNIKDFGKYLPGHGGAMDRLDGIAFNAVFILLVFLTILAI